MRVRPRNEDQAQSSEVGTGMDTGWPVMVGTRLNTGKEREAPAGSITLTARRLGR